MRRQIPDISRLDDPPEDFSAWWSPSKRDRDSGADIGGHPDAERVWSRKEEGRWTHRTYGTNARIAWNAQRFRSEFLQWVAIGKPEREDFVSIAAPLHQQKQLMNGLKQTISRIGKPIPEPQPFDFDNQSEPLPF